jgi:hypothetical protein
MCCLQQQIVFLSLFLFVCLSVSFHLQKITSTTQILHSSGIAALFSCSLLFPRRWPLTFDLLSFVVREYPAAPPCNKINNLCVVQNRKIRKSLTFDRVRFWNKILRASIIYLNLPTMMDHIIFLIFFTKTASKT